MADNESTGLVVVVPEARVFQPFRERHLRVGAEIPPHVTVHGPFKRRAEVRASVLSELADLVGQQAAFPFTLARVARFESSGVLYLAPEPAEPLLALSRAIQARYPESPPEYADPIMHLTLAITDPAGLAAVEAEFEDEYRHLLPMPAIARAVTLYEQRAGRWVARAAFSLRSGRV